MWNNSPLHLVFVLVFAACAKPAPPPPPAPVTNCLADRMGELRAERGFNTSCLRYGPSCVDLCAKRDADGCMSYASALREQKAVSEAEPFVAKACEYGLGPACTSYSTDVLLAHRPPSVEDAACARRLFERACSVRDRIACAWQGRMMADAATTPAERDAARAHFERVCTELPGITCRFYAYHLERGQLGEHDAEAVAELMRRACQGRDVDACGHASAVESFHAKPQ